MNFKITNGTLYTCDKYGNTGRRIADGVTFATFSDSMNIFLVTSLSGRVDTRDTNGNHIRTICNEAIEARFMDDKILVRTRNSNQLRDKQGNLIRNI
jgi:hypothetical protein